MLFTLLFCRLIFYLGYIGLNKKCWFHSIFPFIIDLCIYFMKYVVFIRYKSRRGMYQRPTDYLLAALNHGYVVFIFDENQCDSP